MPTSKNLFFNALFFTCAISTLSACSLPTPQEKVGSGTAATFTAQAMADRSKAVEAKVQGPFALPSSKVFNLQACVKDVAYDKIVAGHEFLIEELNKKVSSDKAGCLNWAETVNYNFLGDSQYIRIERRIRGLGLHRGTQSVSFAINPWSHGENLAPVLSPEDGNSIPRLISDSSTGELALKGFSSDHKTQVRPLWVEDARLFISEQKLTKDGVNLLIEVRPNPSIQMSKMNGELFLRPLSSGTFKARMKLIHVYQNSDKEIRRLLSETPFLDVKMENGTLALKSPLELAAIPTRGQVILGLELQPQNGPEGLLSFEGIYLLGEYDQIKGSSFLKLHSQVAQDRNFKLSSFVNANMMEISRNHTQNSVDYESYQKPKIEVSQLEFRFIRVGSERTSSREVFYNIKACIRHGLDQKSTRAQTFQVTKFNQDDQKNLKTISVKTDNNSCLNWDESISFKYFECQHYIKGSVRIMNPELGMNEKLEILVNPWESQGMLARDLRYVTTSEKLILSCQKEDRPRTQIIADGFSYNTLSYSYSIDSFLNLSVIKKVQFKMDPRLLVYSSLANGRADTEKLRDGVYLLRLAVVQNRDYDTNNTYVTSADRLVNVLSGQINTDITFQTQDLKALGNRNNLLIEIYPVDESKVTLRDGDVILKDGTASITSAIDYSTGLETPTFIGPITLNTDEASRPLRMADPSSISHFFLTGQNQGNKPGKLGIQEIVLAGQKLQAEKVQRLRSKTEKHQFAQDHNLELISLKQADEQAPLNKALTGSSSLNPRLIVNKSDLQKLLRSGTLQPQTAQKLCAFWGNDYFKKIFADKGGVFNGLSHNFSFDCYNAVSKNPASFFKLEKLLLVKEVGASQFQKGLNQGLNVGTSFSLSASHSKSATQSTSINAKVGLSKKFLELISVGLDFGYSLSWSESDYNTASNSISVNSSTSMTVQQNVFKIRVNKHEQCALIRLNPMLFMKDTKFWFGRRDFLSILNPSLTEDEKISAITRGLMICDDQVVVQPWDLIENYYLIAQEPVSAQMQDSGDARNRSFFLAIRSTRDFQRFLFGIKGEMKTPHSALKDESLEQETTKSMQHLFQLGNPTYPGMFLYPASQ